MSQAAGAVAGANQETCQVYCRGQIYEGWTEVSVSASLQNGASTCQLAITEPQQSSEQTAKWTDWQIKPGDPITVKLGGKLAFTGYVDVRQAAFSQSQHGVQITARSNTQDPIDCSVVPDAGGGRYAGYTIDRIARSVLSPFGIALKTFGDMGRAFPVVQIMPGETVFELIERLARQRGLYVHDDETGSMVLSGDQPTERMPALIEGQNIKSATGVLGAEGYSDTLVVMQQASDDHGTTEAASQPHAKISNPNVKRYRPQIIVGEHPGDADDAKQRAQQERSRLIAETAVVDAVVQGWFASPDTLWKLRCVVRAKSPTLLVDQDLIIAGVEFRQSSDEGTTTNIHLITSAGLASYEQQSGDPNGGSNPGSYES
ncbi:hypothetical protein K32_23940 [Kaistia sp. 32K]|uniref:phage baseplate assembly protein n=1 Tax=Kaistia sp. 32K TaxID=2795690 RepID=UPI001916A1A9|nr:hypothetical protein [Kaistia sp. 32K]BCP53777.1 hypothetical protein K32_23940 [Kaistia sp. 32K]